MRENELFNPVFHVRDNGLFQKKSTPPRQMARFFDPPFHLDFQNRLKPPPLRISKFKDPPPIWISIKLLDTVILIYTQCRRILLGS